MRRKLRPIPLSLVTGLIFGLFHVTLFRIIPTGFLGVVLTAVTLLTGSIFPSMLAHAGNNAFALWTAEAGLQVSAPSWRIQLTAIAVFALAFYILYRARTPYPGMRK